LPEIDPEANEPIWGADVVADTGEADVTSGSGGYELYRVPAGDREVTASGCGYFDHTEPVALECGADTKVDLLLVCQGVLGGTVLDDATGTPLEGVAIDLTVDCEDVGRVFELSTETDAAGIWWMLVPLCGDDGEDDGNWTLTKSMDGYTTIEREGDEFADDFGFDSADCVAIGSDGCGLPFCVEDPCLSLIDEEIDNIDPERLVSIAYIQGRVYCDGMVSDNGVFDWGEEQPNTIVRLYEDTDKDLFGDLFMAQTLTDWTGFYQFPVEVDTDHDGDVDAADLNWFTVAAQPVEMAAPDMLADEHRVVNIDICP
jgi:5-hydroxyisourate hydrolase-like protein (transthyretin family)